MSDENKWHINENNELDIETKRYVDIEWLDIN